MALEALERKLEDSVKSLRDENKTLIGLLQSRQADFHSLLHTSAHPTTQQRAPANLRLRERPSSPLTLCVERPVSPTLARQKLSACRGQVDDHAVQEGTMTEASPLPFDHRLHETSVSGFSEGTLLSSPVQTIPKSILKHRELIDKHVRVNSKFDHSEDLASDRVHSGLNYSYEDVLEETIPKWADKEMYRDVAEQSCRDMPISYQHLTVPERHAEVPRVSDVDANAERYLDHLQTQRKVSEDLQQLERKREQQLLTACGNERQAAPAVRQLAQRPHNVLFDVHQPDPDSLEETMKRYKPAREASSELQRFNYKSDLTASRSGRPLLGYDWIAGVLENEGLGEQSEQLLQGLSHFRMQHKDECVGSGPVFEHTADLARPISPQIEDPGHTCIHGFSVNDRLFTEAVNVGEEGRSVCPVCLAPRQPPTQHKPAFVRVSIPKSTVEQAYRITPRTRSSFEPRDSMALSHHCLAGWKSTRPSTLPTAGSLDLKDKVRVKETTTYAEARQVAESFSSMGRLLTSTQPPSQRLTKRLLDANTSFRYEMETIEKLSGLNTDHYRLAPPGKA